MEDAAERVLPSVGFGWCGQKQVINEVRHIFKLSVTAKTRRNDCKKIVDIWKLVWNFKDISRSRASREGQLNWWVLKDLENADYRYYWPLFSAADVEFKPVFSLVVKLIEIFFERCLNRNSICLTSNLAQNMSEKFRHFIRYSTRNFKSTSIVLCACLIWNLFECWWLVENFQ